MTTVPILLGFNGSNYQVTRSLRFRSSASAYLSRTPSVAGSQTIWTWSGWVKRGSLGGTMAICQAGSSTANETMIMLDSDNFRLYNDASSVANMNMVSTAVYRDPSAWYHFLVAYDSTQATNTNRVKMYVNGSQITSFSTATYPAQNQTTVWNSAVAHAIGERRPSADLIFDGYLAEVNFIDGQALTPSSFGYFDLYGVWQPKRYNGTYGTNGFYLPFSNTTSTTTLTADSSGNGNNWTANNISLTAGTTYDSMIDSPTNYADGGTGRGNYATLNPVSTTTAPASGNLNGTGTFPSATSTIAVSSGKWYSEFIVQTVGSQAIACGITNRTNLNNSMSGTGLSYQIAYDSLGRVNNAGTTTTGFATFTANDTIGMAVDCDAGTISFYKNNTLINTVTNSSFFSGNLIAFGAGAGGVSGTDSWWFNFGQRPFTYTPPSGYLALNTQNLPAAPVPYGAPYMNAITYTGYGPLVPSGLGILTKRNASTQNVSKSLRFRSSASAYLNRTPASASNRQKFTWSGWVKRGTQATGALFGAGTTSPDYDAIRFENDQLRFYQGGAVSISLYTVSVFRDPSAWYHVVLSVDTTQATAANRVIIYVNGAQQLLTGTYPSQNASAAINNNYPHAIAAQAVNGIYNVIYDGYMAEINFIDGQALTPSSFGQTNSDGIWVPKAYTGTYGTNGFYLPFTNTTSTTTLVADSSGNGNNWTPNNISLTAGTTYDSMIDSPTDYASAGGYAVFNPLDKGAGITLSNANLTAYSNAQGPYIARSTIPVSSGKWYWEAVQTAQGSGATNNMVNGICPATDSTTNELGYTAGSYGYIDTGNKANNSVVTSYGTTYGLNDIIGVALDLDNGTLTFYKNGVSQGVAFTGISGTFYPAISDRGGGVSKEPTWAINFGQRPFTYSAPSGYSTLNTYNITAPSTTWFSSANNSGNASATAYPDFVWIKSRSSAQNHSLNDTLRGPTLNLITNNVNVEAGASTMFAVNKYGLTLGNDASVNSSSYTDVMWGWQGGNGTTSTNTSGTITSQVSASTTSGFSILTYTGNFTAGATVGHGLGVAPSMILVKTRTQASVDWITYHVSLGPTKGLYMDTGAATTSAIFWNNTSPTASVITLGAGAQSNGNGQNMVAYCWAAIRGFSAFGSYTGNGSTDGPFVYTGFRPRFILTKCSSNSTTSTLWTIWDTSRNTYNASVNELYPNLSNAEGVDSSGIDILSNGFKPKRNSEYANFSGWTYVYAAFAENPFNMSRAR